MSSSFAEILKAEARRWRRFGALVLGLRGREEPVNGPKEEPQQVYDQTDAAHRAQEQEAEAALSRLRQVYHRDTQPLTVARARVDVMRRMEREDRGGYAWQRESG